MLLDSRISNGVWRTLVQLVLGVTLISCESSPNNPIVHNRVHQNWYKGVFDMFDLSYALGVFLALLQTFLSGFGSVYFEKVLKTGRKMNNQSYQSNNDDSKALSYTNIDVWDRNIQLTLCSICIYTPISIWETKGAIFQGWTPLVLVLAALHSMGGILVTLSVLYSSSITKTVAVCAALVCTTGFGHVIFFEPLNGPILLGCGVVIVAVWSYKCDKAIEEKMKMVGLEI